MKSSMIIAIVWVLVFSWNNGFGLEIGWWVYFVAGFFWFLYLRFRKLRVLILFLLFFLNLHINHLFQIRGFTPEFDFERMVLFKPDYIRLIEKYRYDDVWMPFRVRNLFYSGWLMIFYWLDSFFKLISPLIWSRILGLSGLFVIILGIFKVKMKYLWWIITVCLSSGMSILYDTKTAFILGLPAIVLVLSKGFESKIVYKYWWIVLILMIVDLVQK